MSALAPRNSFRIADEQGWLESSDNVGVSPATVWASDYEDEDEITLQGRRVAVQYTGLMSPNLEDGDDEEETLVVETSREVRILDESQVLPGEASFATVSLNQPFKENVLKPQTSSEPISTSNVDDYHECRPALRVRLLDESQVLDGEASFATVMSGKRWEAHSPITEFLVKTKLSVTQLVLGMLALVSVVALGAIVILITMKSEVVTVNSAPPAATADTAPQPVSTSVPTTSSTESTESVLISNSQGGVSGSASSTQATVEATPTADATRGVADAKLMERPSSDDSRKASASNPKSGAVRQEIPRTANAAGARVSSPKERAVETKKPSASVARKAVKEQAVVKMPKASVKSGPRETRPATRKSEVPVEVEKVETKVPPATGGGERPRTVKPRPTP